MKRAIIRFSLLLMFLCVGVFAYTYTLNLHNIDMAHNLTILNALSEHEYVETMSGMRYISAETLWMNSYTLLWKFGFIMTSIIITLLWSNWILLSKIEYLEHT